MKAGGIPVHGLVAGDTHAKKRAYMDELHASVKRLGIENDLTFLGHRDDIREVMAASDIVLALSQQPESFGRTVLEALALGKRVVGYDCGGVGELLGTLFPAGRVPLGTAHACSKPPGPSSATARSRWRLAIHSPWKRCAAPRKPSIGSWSVKFLMS